MPDDSGELETILDYIRWAATRFKRNNLFCGPEGLDVLSDARSLILGKLKLPPDVPDIYLNSKLDQTEKKEVRNIVNKRISSRKPSAYLTNEAWFAGLGFYVDERVLVPRSPVGELISKNFSPWINYNNSKRILDLCTGSGCIAIACAYAFPHAQIDAVDISEDALEVAKINRRQHGLDDVVSLHHGDLWHPVKGSKYDIIIANPPYVNAEDMLNLPEEIRKEPHIGLAAGEEGLDVVVGVIKNSFEHLNEGGVLVVEVGNSAAALIANYPKLDFTWLDFEFGGHGVFLLTKQQLQNQ